MFIDFHSFMISIGFYRCIQRGSIRALLISLKGVSMEFSTFMYFLLSSILITLAPGPDSLYLLAKSISDGAKQGIILAGGLASGIIFHTTLVIVGVAAVIASTPVAFQLLKYLGAFYLFYLARQAYSAKPVPGKKMPIKQDSETTKNTDNADTSDIDQSAETAAASSGKPKSGGFAIFRKGLLMNILNPKVLLFFLAFLPQFVNPAGPEPGVQVAILGLTFSIQAFVIFTIIALCAGKLGNLINKNENSQIIMNKIQGLVLLIIGGFLLLF